MRLTGWAGDLDQTTSEPATHHRGTLFRSAHMIPQIDHQARIDHTSCPARPPRFSSGRTRCRDAVLQVNHYKERMLASQQTHLSRELRCGQAAYWTRIRRT